MATEWRFLGVPLADGSGTKVVTLTLRSARQASQTGTYLSDLGQVQSGWLSSRDFESRWRGVSIGGAAVEWRADNAVEAMRQAGPPPGAPRYRRMWARGRS